MAKAKGTAGRQGRSRATAETKATTGGGSGNGIEQEAKQRRGKVEAEAPEKNARLPEEIDLSKGNVVQVFGADVKNRYSLRYEIRDLDTLITSNTESGAVNPEYPRELQPRDRTRAASRAQIDRMASNLEPDALTTEFMALDRGAPIIGDDNIVESGNARTMALQRAASLHPEQYAAYREAVREIAKERGIDPAALEQYKAPVLVRVRVDDVDRVAFAQEANTQTILGMSDTERARSDAARITTEDLVVFEAGDNIDTDIRRASNRDMVRAFVSRIPEGERAALMDRGGELTQSGVKRLKAAMFTRVYDDARLSDRIFESTDNDMKNITNAMMGTLGALSRTEEMVRTGQRAGDLSITEDVTAAVSKLAEIKTRGDMSVEMYLQQTSMFGGDLTDTQKGILTAIHERRRSGKKIKEFLSGWATLVEREPHPQQMGMFGSAGSSKDQLLQRWLSGQGWEQQSSQSSLF